MSLNVFDLFYQPNRSKTLTLIILAAFYLEVLYFTFIQIQRSEISDARLTPPPVYSLEYY